MAFSVLEPVTITDAMLTSVSVAAEDDSAVWVSGQPGNSYQLHDVRHRVETHSVYERVKVSDSAAGETTPPESDPVHWHRMRPTNKWAMFDPYPRTRTVAQERLEVVLRPGGFITALWLGGVRAQTAQVKVQSRPGGTVVYISPERRMDRALRDRWSLYWMARPQFAEDDLHLGLRPCIDPVITVTLTGQGEVGLGILLAGQTVRLGETFWGASAGPVGNSYVDFKEDGTAQWLRRDPTRALVGTVEVLARDTNLVNRVISRLDGTPALYIASEQPGHEPLRVFGFLQNQPSQLLRLENAVRSTQPINVIGL